MTHLWLTVPLIMSAVAVFMLSGTYRSWNDDVALTIAMFALLVLPSLVAGLLAVAI